MFNLLEFNGKKPNVHSNAFIWPTAQIIGEVDIREYASVWSGSIVRGDDEKVIINRYTAILENCLIEAPKDCPVEINNHAIISHGAILHGCKIGSHSLIGIGAIVLDGVEINEGVIVGAGTVVPPKTIIPAKAFVLGIPAKIVRQVTEDESISVSKEIDLLIKKLKKYNFF